MVVPAPELCRLHGRIVSHREYGVGYCWLCFADARRKAFEVGLEEWLRRLCEKAT